MFCADVKSDLSGIAEAGEAKPWIEARDKEIGFKNEFKGYPVIFWDLFGEQGHPIRSTISEMGPLLLSRLMDLSEAQEGVLNIAFKIAGDENMPLVDLKDLQALLEDLAARADTLTTKYGNITKASVGSIQRSLLVLEQQGGAHFFGEPALDIKDLMRTTRDGRGYISILAAQTLMNSPRLYATFLLFLLSELFAKLPEVGDPDKPKLVFFFDEAHLLFKDAPKALLQKGRAGGAPDQVEGRRRLFRDAESARRSRHGVEPARQPRPARAARLHADGAEGGEGSGHHFPCQPCLRYREGDHGARRRRGVGFHPR